MFFYSEVLNFESCFYNQSYLLHLFYYNKETHKKGKEKVLQSLLVYHQSFLLDIYFLC